MSKSRNKNDDHATEPTAQSRRELLKNAGSLASYVAPAMVVLIPGSHIADAHHRPDHTSNCNNFPSSPYCTSAF